MGEGCRGKGSGCNAFFYLKDLKFFKKIIDQVVASPGLTLKKDQGCEVSLQHPFAAPRVGHCYLLVSLDSSLSATLQFCVVGCNLKNNNNNNIQRHFFCVIFIVVCRGCSCFSAIQPSSQLLLGPPVNSSLLK